MASDAASLTLVERIRAALALGESHFREFKSALDGPPDSKTPRDPRLIRRDIGEALVAFANADGGELVVGVEDDGSVTGVPHPSEIVTTLVEAWKHNVHRKTPLPPPRVARVDVDGHLVIYFAIEKSATFVHLTQDGRCLQRRDRETVPVPSEQVRFERQERLSREYDRAFVDGGDPSALELDLAAEVAEQVAPRMSVEKVLQLLDLAEFTGDRVRLRRAAVLLLGKSINHWHPRCEVRILRVAGTELRTGRDYNVVSDKHVSGCILALLSSAWEELRPYLIETRLGPGGRFEEQVRYPEDACREALTNAIAHRDYSMEGRAIEVYVFDDRLEVRSPGALLSTVTIEGLRSLQGVHQSRNTTIARTLRELGYMREMGEGFRRIFHLMRAHDLVEPEIAADDQSFVVSLHHQSIFSQEDQRWIEAYEGFGLTREEEKVLLLGRQGHPLSVQQIMDVLDLVDTEDYRVLIFGLQQKGLIRGIQRRTGARNRNDPRWKVVQPDDANRYLGGLLQACQAVYRNRAYKPQDFAAIARSLSEDTPFIRQQGLRGTLLRLGFVDAEGNPVGSLRALIESVPTTHPGIGSSHTDEVDGEAGTHGAVDILDAGWSGANDDVLSEASLERESAASKLFVGNLAYETTAPALRDFLRDNGFSVRIDMPRDVARRSQNRGYAFVAFESTTAAKQAKDMLNGATLEGRKLNLEWARS